MEEAYVDENGTGYLHLIQFTERTAEEVKAALYELRSEGMVRLILDLRDNSGGLLAAAIEVADIFLEKDRLIVSVKGREGANSRDFRSASRQLFSEPLVVLLNEEARVPRRSWLELFRFLIVLDWLVSNPSGKAPFRRFFHLATGLASGLRPPCIFCLMARTIHEQGIEPDFLVPCSEANETKLRIQRYGDPSLSSREFEELFGFTRVRDAQKPKRSIY